MWFERWGLVPLVRLSGGTLDSLMVSDDGHDDESEGPNEPEEPLEDIADGVLALMEGQ